MDSFREFAGSRTSAVIFGVFIEDPPGHYFNSAVGIAPAEPDLRRYSKRHLVPFGEFIPIGFRWFVDRMQMPIGDQQRGRADQRPMELAGQQIAVNICYEDLFGEEIIQAWHAGGPPPTILLNLSNLAWFDDSWALPQHLQISRMRALETQHPMLRATNTGATAIINSRGVVAGALPTRTAGALEGLVQGFAGTTPFIRFGNAPALLACAVLLAAALLARRRLRR
jgi:apolipoprotein N-acyltransferase